MEWEHWPIELYRFTYNDGWQKQEQTAQATLTASPRKDCIVIPALRQKFTLCTEGGEQSSVIRRNSSLLLVSRRRTRAMLLNFFSLQECLDFSDQFTKLNRPSPFVEEEHKEPEATARDRDEVVSYVTQLLHSTEFLSLVGKLEIFVKSTQDGAKLFKDLEEQGG
jgi:hypothetical protein